MNTHSLNSNLKQDQSTTYKDLNTHSPSLNQLNIFSRSLSPSVTFFSEIIHRKLTPNQAIVQDTWGQEVDVHSFLLSLSHFYYKYTSTRRSHKKIPKLVYSRASRKEIRYSRYYNTRKLKTSYTIQHPHPSTKTDIYNM